MALTADRVIVELEAKLDQFATDLRTGEATFNQSMDRIAAKGAATETTISQSATGMSTSLDKAGQSAGALTGAVGEMAGAMGNASGPVGAVATQVTQLSGAMGTAEKIGTVLGTVMGSVIVLAAIAAVAALVELIAKHNEENRALAEAIQKKREAAQQDRLAAEAERIYADSIEGTTDALYKSIEALRERQRTQSQSMALDAAEAQARVRRLEAEARTRAEGLADQERRVRLLQEQAKETPLAATSTEAATIQAEREAALRRETERLEAMRSQYRGLSNDIAVAKQSFTEYNNALVAHKLTLEPIARLNEQLKRDLAEAGKLPQAEAASTMARLVAEHKKAVDAEREKAKAARETNKELAKQVSFAEAAAIASRAGLRVTSTRRPTWMADEVPGGPTSQERLYNQYVAAGRPRGQPVARPGTSAHEGTRGRWAIDIGLAPGLTAGRIKEVFAAEGVKVSVLQENRNFHVSGTRGAAAMGASAEAAEAARLQGQMAREAVQQAQIAAQQAKTYNARAGRLNDMLLDATEQRAQSTQQQLEFDIAAIERAGAMEIQENLDLEATGRIAEGKAELLNIEVDKVTKARIAARKDEELRRSDEIANDLALRRQEELVDQAAHEVAMAETGKQRRDALYNLLEAETELRRMKWEQVRDNAVIGSAEHQRALLELELLEAAKARRGQDIENDPSAKSPLERYIGEIDKSADRINEDLERVTVEGLETLTDGITDAIMGAKSLGDVFDEVANQIIAALIRIAVQQLIIAPLAKALGGLFGGGMATGGNVHAGTTYLVGEQGPELFTASGAGTITPNHELVAGRDSGRGGGDLYSFTVNAPGATAETVAMIRRELQGAAPTIIAAAKRSTISELQRPRI